MGILDAEQTDSATCVVLGRHGSSTPVMGAGPGPDRTAVATIHGDGVVVYDCDAQTKTRSWAVGRGHALAAPAVFDRGCGRYFAALLPPGETDPALVTWTDADPIASLDQAVDSSSTRLPDGIAALVAVGEGNDGGVIVVDVGGGARWFGADARKLAASAPPGEGGGDDDKKKKTKTGSASAKRVAETCGEANGGGGVVVVTADRSNVDVRTVTLYKVAGGEHSGRSVKTAWEFEVSVPEGATRAVAVAGSDDDACVMWSNGVWRAYTSHDDESRMRTLVTAGGANETPGVGGGGAAGKRAGGKRGAAASADNKVAVLPAASMASLGGGFYAVAQVGPGCGGGARIAVLDSKYGCVHSCAETHPQGSSGGVETGVKIAALPDADGDRRLVVAIAGEVVLAEVAVPGRTVTLLDVLGRLNLAAGPDGPAGPAIKVLGMANAREASKPPQYSIYTPKFPKPTPRPTDPNAPPLDAMIDLGDPVENGWWGPDPAAEKMAEDAVNKFYAFDDEPLTATEAAEMLNRFKTVEHVDIPPAVLAAGIEGCLRRKLWAPLRNLVDEGYLTHSCQAPGLAKRLVAAGRFADLDAFLRLAHDVDGADIRACLEAFLDDEGVAVPAKAIEEVATRQVKFANDAVVEAERTAKAARTAKDRHALSAASAAKVALHRARIATAAVEAFDGMPRAPLLHALCARPLCPEYATEALPDLPPASATRLVRYLSVWLDAYSGGDGKDDATESPVDAATTPPEGLPALREVVAWAGAVIDAHFTAFAMNRGSADDTAGGDDEDSDAMATLRRAAARLQAGCASVGRVNGALVHVRDGAPLPENQGVQSSTYSIELVDW